METPPALTKRLKASLVFWKQSMNSASLGGFARRVSIPSARRRGREGHISESITFGKVPSACHAEGTVEVGVKTTTAKNQGFRERQTPSVCQRLCDLCQRCPWTAAPPKLPCLDLWLCHSIHLALLGRELRCPARLQLCPPVLPVCCSCCTVPAGPFFLFFFPFFLWLSCRYASAAFWSRATNTSMSSRVQFRICCEDRNPRDQHESEPGLHTAESLNPRVCCITWENAHKWAIQA